MTDPATAVFGLAVGVIVVLIAPKFLLMIFLAIVALSGRDDWRGDK